MEWNNSGWNHLGGGKKSNARFCEPPTVVVEIVVVVVVVKWIYKLVTCKQHNSIILNGVY